MSTNTHTVMNSRVQTVESADGTPIAVWITGSGPTLLAITGTGTDHTAWDLVAPLLAPRCTVAVIDRRGRGLSGDSPAYTFEREIEDAVAVSEALPGPVHLYGHSFGGGVALHAASRISGLASLMVYEGVTGGMLPRGMVLAPPDLIAELDDLVATDRREEALELFLRTNVRMSPDEIDAYRVRPGWEGRVRSAHTIGRELAASSGAGEPDWNVGVPVLLISGEATPPERRAWFESFAGRFADGRVARLPGVGHTGQTLGPDLLAAVIDDFITGVAAGSPHPE